MKSLERKNNPKERLRESEVGTKKMKPRVYVVLVLQLGSVIKSMREMNL